jgi:hypothetical protein
VTNNNFRTREAWLQAFATEARPHFKDAGFPLPENIRMAVGFTSKGDKGKRIGECWASEASQDGTFEIFIVPRLSDSARVADILTHELAHCAAGIAAGHGPIFGKLARALGLEGKLTATTGGEKWHLWANPILDALGPIPHASLGSSAISSGPKKQTTRMIKVTCDTCGFSFRTSRQWIDKAGDEGLRCPDVTCDGHAAPEA